MDTKGTKNNQTRIDLKTLENIILLDNPELRFFTSKSADVKKVPTETYLGLSLVKAKLIGKPLSEFLYEKYDSLEQDERDMAKSYIKTENEFILDTMTRFDYSRQHDYRLIYKLSSVQARDEKYLEDIESKK